jgi:gliding motility-associated-like protein
LTAIGKHIGLWIVFFSFGASLAQTEIRLQSGKYYVCEGDVLDSENGKNTGYYDHNENIIMTLAIPGAKKIRLDFKEFCTEPDNDILSIFNGKDTNAPLIGRYHGTKGPGTIESSDSFITLHFISDKSVSCTGWLASISKELNIPKKVVLSLSNVVRCGDDYIDIECDYGISCDSFNTQNTFIDKLNINKIEYFNCTNNLSKKFRIYFDKAISSNGTFYLTHTHGYRDFCDSLYFQESSTTFAVNSCPITVQLIPTNDTLCKGSCIRIRAQVSGGNSANYQYKWSQVGLSGNNPRFCPTQSQKVFLEVSDGNALPGSDTVEIIVVEPPKVQSDTQLCYYGPTVILKAEPEGGTWHGTGIVDSKAGTFNPRLTWGNTKVWYRIGNCADTMTVFVSAPYNYENVFCPSTTPQPVYWYGPLGGNWTGPKITESGIFTPDSSGVFKVTYTWQGCISEKEIRVESVSVIPFDTTCESKAIDTLTFSPKGLIVGYFNGLINAYWGWYNPSMMGGPGNYPIVFNAQGGCKDTTMVAVLPSFAGNDQVVCPENSAFALSGFRKTSDALWEGKGIIDAVQGIYDPSWTNGKEYIDTVYLKSGKCVDYKLIHIKKTEVYEDTILLCPENSYLDLKQIPVSVPSGFWFGESVSHDSFCTKCLSDTFYTIGYEANGCFDSVVIEVLEKSKAPNDTSVCSSSEILFLNSLEKGIFWGNDVTNGNEIHLNKRKSDTLDIYFINENQCKTSFNVIVQNPAVINFSNFMKQYCFRDSTYQNSIIPDSGLFIWGGSNSGSFNPQYIGPGVHVLKYRYHDGVCESLDSTVITILDSISGVLFSSKDSICSGESSTMEALSMGGLGLFQYQWSHGQTGIKSLVKPSVTSSFSVEISDGCSNVLKLEKVITVNPNVWFRAEVSDSVCYGTDGYIIANLRYGDSSIRRWNYQGYEIGDTFFAPAGSSYRIFMTDAITGCYGDTAIRIPAYRGISTSIIKDFNSLGRCYSSLDSVITFKSSQSDIANYRWRLNDSLCGNNATLLLKTSESDLKNTNILSLWVSDSHGCADSNSLEFCFIDTLIVFTPNAFTPNNDGINDVWNWDIIGANEVQVIIYNRWGEILFRSKELSGVWDGKYQLEECPEGVYMAYINYKGKKHPRRNSIHPIMLLRSKE